MKNFSIFEYALNSASQHRIQDLGQIASILRRDFDGRESFVCSTMSASVEYACLMIENALLLRTNRSGRVYAGFEKLSSFEPVIDRYLRIADISEVVYLFGEDDWQPRRHPNIRVINLRPDSPLTRESFLITRSSTLNIAFVALRQTDRGSVASDLIQYLALKTSDPVVVSELTLAIEGVIDWTLAA